MWPSMWMGLLLWMASSLSTPSDSPNAEGWVRLRMPAHEDIEDLAHRYGVSVEEVEAWNELSKKPETGTLLRLLPRKTPPPRHRRTVKVRKGDSWSDVAERYQTTVDALRTWNPRYARRRRPPKGAALSLWLESGVRNYPLPALDDPLPTVDAPAGAVSWGRPNRGKLIDGVQLPPSDLYTIRFDRLAYGTSLSVHAVMQAIAAFRQETGFEGEINIGAMSRRTGRRLRPHRSHQSGRDIDIRLPALSLGEGEAKLSVHEVDWFATFALIDAFVRTGVVQVVFLERKFYRRLRRAGMRLGASDERIEAVMSEVRHSKGHTSHMHVRFICSPAAESCRD